MTNHLTGDEVQIQYYITALDSWQGLNDNVLIINYIFRVALSRSLLYSFDIYYFHDAPRHISFLSMIIPNTSSIMTRNLAER
jgi:hypothetical protein